MKRCVKWFQSTFLKLSSGDTWRGRKLSCGSYPVHFRIDCSILGLYSLDASGTHANTPFAINKSVFRSGQCHLGWELGGVWVWRAVTSCWEPLFGWRSYLTFKTNPWDRDDHYLLLVKSYLYPFTGKERETQICFVSQPHKQLVSGKAEIQT